jgi:hypothetical protein
VSRELVSRLERGQLRGVTIESLDRIAMALGASVQVQLRWRGEGLDRLMDAAHAAMQDATASLLTELGWSVRVEVSFNHYGDRGRVDILAFHVATRLLLIVELKSALSDLQETLGRLNVKVRLGRALARDLGWTDVGGVVPALVIGDPRRSRQTVAAHPALFDRFELRGRAALAWLRRPRSPHPSGVLWFAKIPNSRHMTVKRVHRVRKVPNAHLA